MEERRQFQRLYLRRYEQGNVCHVTMGDVEFDARLLDVSCGGARLSVLESPGEFEPHARGILASKGNSAAHYLRNVRCALVWRQEGHFGVVFDTPLDVPYSRICNDLAPCK